MLLTWQAELCHFRKEKGLGLEEGEKEQKSEEQLI